MNEKIEKWLDRYHNANTGEQMKSRLVKFLNAVKLSEDQLVDMTSEQCEELILNYQRVEEAKGTKNNTILSIIAAPRALFKVMHKPLSLKGQLVQLEEATDKHVFSNGDLSKMFDVADTRGKTLITVGTSLGWGISDVLALDKQFIQTEIARAKESNTNFIFFKRQRGKTHAKALAVLNPLAIEWLDKWLAINKSDKLFDVIEDQINNDLKRYAIEAQIKTTGAVTFHCFRAWVLSSLVKAGFSEWEAKFIVGKSIPLSDVTYLHLEEEIKEKYPLAYDKYLNIKTNINGEQLKKLGDIETQLQEQRKSIESLKTQSFIYKTTIELIASKLNLKGTVEEIMRDLEEEAQRHANEPEGYPKED